MEKIGDILVEMKACTPHELQIGLQTQAIFGGKIGTNLLELGIVDETQLAAALSRAYGVQCISGNVDPDPAAVEALPASLAEKFGVVPLSLEGRRLRVAVSEPRNLSKLDELAFALGKTVVPVLAAESRVWSMLKRFYGIDVHLRGLAMDEDLSTAVQAGPRQATSRGGGGRVLSLEDAISHIEQATDPTLLSTLLVRAAAALAGRAVFLKCHEGYASGWLGAGRVLSLDVRTVNVPIDHESWFGPAVELRAPVLGPVRSSTGTNRFFAALGQPLPLNSFLAPVLLRGRVVALLYADAGPGGTLRDEIAGLVSLAAAINKRFLELAPV